MARPWFTLILARSCKLPLLWILRVSTVFRGHRAGNLLVFSILTGNAQMLVMYGR